jgi:transcription elongation GreA/GreB family factor
MLKTAEEKLALEQAAQLEFEAKQRAEEEMKAIAAAKEQAEREQRLAQEAANQAELTALEQAEIQKKYNAKRRSGNVEIAAGS